MNIATFLLFVEKIDHIWAENGNILTKYGQFS